MTSKGYATTVTKHIYSQKKGKVERKTLIQETM